MENGQQAAFATASDSRYQAGLTKREYFAGLAMQGMMANRDLTSKLCSEVAKWSVEMADALLVELERTKEK